MSDPRTRSWIINAITRLVAQLGYLPDYVHTQIALNLTSVDTDIQQVMYTHMCRGALCIRVCGQVLYTHMCRGAVYIRVYGSCDDF